MKIILSLLLLAGFAQAQHHHHGGTGDRKTVHGHLVFGTTEKIYLSHLPLFGRNHDYQSIVEVSFNKEALEKYQKSLELLGSEEDAMNLNKYHTMEPEVFILPDMIKEGNTFEARLVRGHFERDNHTDVDMNVTVTINRIIHFEKFDPKMKRDEKSRWILFGNKEEQFVAHLITQKPDFDQIFSGSVPGGVAKQLEEKNEIVTTSELVNAPVVLEDLSEGNLSLTNGDKDVNFSKMSQIYLEEAELQ